MDPPLVIAVAPNGARRTRSDHPAVPVTVAQIAREAAACREAGAVLIHLHVRDGAGRHTLDPDIYRDAIAAIRREAGPELIVQITTESVGRFTPAEQMATVRQVRPEAASVAIGELIPDAKSENAAAAFLAQCASYGMRMQYILYSRDDVGRYHDLLERGIIPTRRGSVLFVLGRHTPGERSRPADLMPLLEAYHGRAPWFVCAFGPGEAACVLAGAERGGHARVGFENNLTLADGELAPDNAALVAQLAASPPAVRRGVASYGAALSILDA